MAHPHLEGCSKQKWTANAQSFKNPIRYTARYRTCGFSRGSVKRSSSVCTKKYKSEMKKKRVKWKLKKQNGTRSTFYRQKFKLLKNQNIEGKIKDASWRLLFIIISETSLVITINIKISDLGINSLDDTIDCIKSDK